MSTEEAEVVVPRPGQAFYIKRAVGAILLVAMAAVFAYSGYTKIYSDNAFDNFQWTFIDLGISSQLVAGVVARMMIGLEWMLALYLLLHIFLRQFTYKAILAILAVFCIYLLLLIAKQGNNGNCGCFGDKLAMTPLTAIVKNLVMIGVTAILMRIYPIRPYKNQEIFCIPVAGLAFSLPFLLMNMDPSNAPVAIPGNHVMHMDKLHQSKPAPEVDLRTGKHIIAFMTVSCPHCRKAAYLLQIIHRKHPEIPMYIILAGPADEAKGFFDETHAGNVPHILYKDFGDFTAMAGDEGWPAIYWVNNGVIEYKSKRTYYQLDPKYMQHWLGK